jgi:hypothetical protein|nr:MAG TPA: SOS-response transcriptional repressor [Caudoviricetes sp.]
MNIYDKVMNIKRIKEAIDASKFGKSELSKLAKVSRTTIDNLLLGADVKVSTIENLANVLKIPVGFFFDDSNFVHVSASGNQSIATNSGDVTVGTQNKRDGDHIDTQNNCGCQNEEDRQDTVKTLTDTVATLTRELETSLQQKSSLIEIVANFQKQLQQFIEIMHHSNNK